MDLEGIVLWMLPLSRILDALPKVLSADYIIAEHCVEHNHCKIDTESLKRVREENGTTLTSSL